MKHHALVCLCHDCDEVLMVRGGGLGGGYDNDWFMLKDRIWREATRGTDVRCLCIACLEQRLGREVNAKDFKRSAKVNFVGNKSARLRTRMRGLKPAKRLVDTAFRLTAAARLEARGAQMTAPPSYIADTIRALA